MLAQDSPLRPADVKLLAVVQRDNVCSARHRADAAHHFDVGQRAASESDEMRRIEAGFQVPRLLKNGRGFFHRHGAIIKKAQESAISTSMARIETDHRSSNE